MNETMNTRERYEGIDGMKAYAIIGTVLMHILANGKYGLGGFVFERLIPSFTNLVFLFMMISGFVHLFKAVHEYLVNGGKSCMAGFVLKNTLSDNGGVTRGICKMDENGNLTEVVETKNIVKTATGAEADGKVTSP